jgi:hypothetical protein
MLLASDSTTSSQTKLLASDSTTSSQTVPAEASTFTRK